MLENILPLPARPLALGELREDVLPRKTGLETSLSRLPLPSFSLWLIMLGGPLYTLGYTGELGLSGSRPTGMAERTGQVKGAHLTR